MKLLQSNKKDVLLLMEYHNHYLKLYFADGHSELKDDDIKHYIQKYNTGYKHPIYIYEQWLYPTGDYHQKNCCWIQLDCLEKFDLELKSLLQDKQTKFKVKKLYLHHIEKKLTQNGF